MSEERDDFEQWSDECDDAREVAALHAMLTPGSWPETLPGRPA